MVEEEKGVPMERMVPVGYVQSHVLGVTLFAKEMQQEKKSVLVELDMIILDG